MFITATDYEKHCFDDLRPAYSYYNGAAKKFSVFYDDKIFMIKCPAKAKMENELNTSYSHNSFSEFISCHIINALQIPNVTAQHTLLGVYQDKLSVACEDFTTPQKQLVSFDMVHNTNTNSEASGRHPILQDTLETYEITPVLREHPIFLQRFWDTFILDALLGNYDRHSGNWGFLNNPYTGEMELAPIFDCGSCLYPALSDESLDRILSSREEIDKRLYTFPLSALKDRDSGEKLNYTAFLSYTADKNCLASLQKITECFSMNAIESVLNQTPYISDKRRTFYHTMIQERFQNILLPAYERNISRNFISPQKKDLNTKPFSERLLTAKEIADQNNENRSGIISPKEKNRNI